MLNLLSQSTKEKEFKKERAELEGKFYRLMFELGHYNKFNRTYYLKITEKTNYGYLAKMYLEPGLSFAKLYKDIGDIQENLCCIWIMETEQLRDYANVKIVTRPVDKTTPYENPQIKPWEMYLGLDFALDVIKNNNNENCMFLLAGATGSGKTRFIYMILLSWVIGCKVNEVEIYLSDIAKNEYVNLQYVKHVRYYAYELEQLLNMMKYIEIKMKKRKKVISKYREQGLATNIEEYNKVSKAKMAYCYIVIDEASVIIQDKSDNNEEKEMKQTIIDVLKRISKTGRSLGVFCLIATQKTTRDEIPSIIKNMSAVRISFQANDSISSEVIIGDNSAVGLMKRYAIYSLNGGAKKDYLFSPAIEMSDIQRLLKPYTDKNFRKKDVEYEVKASKPTEQPPAKVYKLPKKKKKTGQHYDLIDTSKGVEIIDC